MLVAAALAAGALGAAPAAGTNYEVCAAYSVHQGGGTTLWSAHCAVPVPWSNWVSHQECVFVPPADAGVCWIVRVAVP